MENNALHALRRFGFGRRGMEPLPADVTQWLNWQLEAPDPVLAEPGPTLRQAIEVDRLFKEGKAEMNPGMANPGMANPGMANPGMANPGALGPPLEIPGMAPSMAMQGGPPGAMQGAMPGAMGKRPGLGDLFRDQMNTLLKTAVSTDLPLRERLVWFWSNHFAISERSGPWPLGFAGAYVYDAIRPHVTGRFVDMLKAVMRHPAMLTYLDNSLSAGPHSPVGEKQHRGINENLARECLELHTLGLQGGYTQQDVTSFAAILTGRGIKLKGDDPGFIFRDNMAEPGPKMFMGRRYPAGFEGSEQVLDWLGTHPATYRHIANKLVVHFVADTPPPGAVDRVAAALGKSGGNLKQAMRAIFAIDEAWVPLSKFRAPVEYVVSVLRALDLPFKPPQGTNLVGACKDVGEAFMGPVMPNGWPDTAQAWNDGELLLKRADWAMIEAVRPGAPDADAVGEATLASLYSDRTRQAVASSASKPEALATLLVSPEFFRR